MKQRWPKLSENMKQLTHLTLERFKSIVPQTGVVLGGRGLEESDVPSGWEVKACRILQACSKDIPDVDNIQRMIDLGYSPIPRACYPDVFSEHPDIIYYRGLLMVWRKGQLALPRGDDKDYDKDYQGQTEIEHHVLPLHHHIEYCEEKLP